MLWLLTFFELFWLLPSLTLSSISVLHTLTYFGFCKLLIMKEINPIFTHFIPLNVCGVYALYLISYITTVCLLLLLSKWPSIIPTPLAPYFRDRVVFAQTASGMVKKEMTYGVLQGSILGTLLWNIVFDDILKYEVPSGLSIICYTDNTLVVTTEDDIPCSSRR